MRSRFNLILLFFIIPPTTQAVDYQPYVTAQAMVYTKPIAIKGIADDWKPPFYGGDRALAYSRIESGVYWQEWRLGVVDRCDYLLEFSPQTAELVYLSRNRLPLEASKEYDIYLKAEHNCSQGIKLGRKKNLTPTLSAYISGSYLRNKKFTDGSVSGSALVLTEDDYNFGFDADYLYSDDPLFERRVGLPVARGYSLDVGFDWRPLENLSAQLDIIDLTSRMFWDDAPHTTAVATSDTKTYDEDGYVRYDPAITGTESFKKFEHTLPRKFFLAAQYQWTDNLEALIEHQNFEIINFTSIGVGGWLRQTHHFQALYNSVNAVTLRYMWRKLHVELGGDKSEINSVRYFKIQLSYSHTF